MYFNELRRTGGEQAVYAGQRALATVETSPLDYQRTLIHSRFGKNRLKYSSGPGDSFQWVAVGVTLFQAMPSRPAGCRSPPLSRPGF